MKYSAGIRCFEGCVQVLILTVSRVQLQDTSSLVSLPAKSQENLPKKFHLIMVENVKISAASSQPLQQMRALQDTDK